MVMFGLGGIHVEVFKDVNFKLVPLSPSEAREMMDGVKSAALLDGVRGQPGVDRESIQDMLMRISALLSDHPEIAELDFNPVMAFPGGQPATVVDVRIRVDREGEK